MIETRVSMDGDTKRFVVFGAAPDTNNLGVSALLESLIAAVRGVDHDASFSVADNGTGIRSGVIPVGEASLDVRLLGARHSKRLHRADTLVTAASAAALGGLANPLVHEVSRSAAVLDASGGDSFSDIYGWHRFSQVLLHKELAIRVGRPLLLLPQTYGPFESTPARRLARRVLRNARVAMARDDESYAAMKSLLGDQFDSRRHRRGVDMAFALPIGTIRLDDELENWLSRRDATIGLNISGLLYSDPASRTRFGLASDYPALVDRILDAIVRRTDASVLLVPHVTTGVGHPESDIEAAQRALSRSGAGDDRIRIAPVPRTASEAKGLISRLDFFAGSRMHSTIAALSSGIPAVALAYSGKARGVFESAASGDSVADLRTASEDEVVEQLLDCFGRRHSTRAVLAQVLPALIRQASDQVVDAVEFCTKTPEGTDEVAR